MTTATLLILLWVTHDGMVSKLHYFQMPSIRACEEIREEFRVAVEATHAYCREEKL